MVELYAIDDSYRRRIGTQYSRHENSAAAQVLADAHNLFQPHWNALSRKAKATEISNHSERIPTDGEGVLLAGRFLLPELGKPSYWGVQDNRVHFSRAFDSLSDQDKMLLANQVLVLYAAPSQKLDDVQSAALAVSQNGHMFVAHNTEETQRMQWTKECAEVNLTSVVKQLVESGDKISRLYVLGGLTDSTGKVHVDDHLIGMCMRCVEVTSPIMAQEAKVIIIPANDGTVDITLRECDSIKQIKPREAWQVDYATLRKDYIMIFPDAVNARQAGAFDKLKAGAIDPVALLKPYADKLDAETVLNQAREGRTYIPILETVGTLKADDPYKLEVINAYMVAQLARAIKPHEKPPSEVGIAVLEITEEGKQRYECGYEIIGDANAVTSPIATAASHAGISIPHKSSDARVTAAYVMAYNADGTPYIMNSEVGDRLIKRVGEDYADSTPVIILPLNDGHINPGDELHKTVRQMVPTDYIGAKQHTARGRLGDPNGSNPGKCC